MVSWWHATHTPTHCAAHFNAIYPRPGCVRQSLTMPWAAPKDGHSVEVPQPLLVCTSGQPSVHACVRHHSHGSNSQQHSYQPPRAHWVREGFFRDYAMAPALLCKVRAVALQMGTCHQSVCARWAPAAGIGDPQCPQLPPAHKCMAREQVIRLHCNPSPGKWKFTSPCCQVSALHGWLNHITSVGTQGCLALCLREVWCHLKRWQSELISKSSSTVHPPAPSPSTSWPVAPAASPLT